MPRESAVGVVGLGNMGGVLAARLARDGSVTGFDAAAERRDAAAAQAGVAIAESAAAVANAVDVLVLSLPRPEASRAVLEEALEPLGDGGLVIETSTIGPADARTAHALAAERGAGYVDAAILSGVEQVRDGTSAFLVGGEPGDVERAEPVLRRVCERVLRFGGPGTGMAAKVVNNAVAHAEMVVLVEAAALAAAEGIALDMARAGGVPLFAMQAADTVYELALKAGLARKDYAAIATLWED